MVPTKTALAPSKATAREAEQCAMQLDWAQWAPGTSHLAQDPQPLLALMYCPGSWRFYTGEIPGCFEILLTQKGSSLLRFGSCCVPPHLQQEGCCRPQSCCITLPPLVTPWTLQPAQALAASPATWEGSTGAQGPGLHRLTQGMKAYRGFILKRASKLQKY